MGDLGKLNENESTNSGSTDQQIERAETLPSSEQQPAAGERSAQGGPPALLADILKAAAGRSGGLVGAAVDEFLSGKGELLDVVRSSLIGRKTAAKKKIAAFLEEKFKLSADVALVLSALLIKVAPAAGSLAEKTVEKEKKPSRKKPTVKKKAAKTPKKAASKAAPKKKITAPRKKTTPKASAKKANKTSTKAKKPSAKSKQKAK